MSDLSLVARNENFEEIRRILTEQQGRKLDVIVPATKIRLSSGYLIVEGVEAHVDDDGVTPVDGVYEPGDAFYDGVSDKLNIPRLYLRRLVTERPDILESTVNSFLHGRVPVELDNYWDGEVDENGKALFEGEPAKGIYPPDSRKFLVRLFRGNDGSPGVARALLGERYALTMDNLDVLTAILGGVQLAGVPVNITSCDLSERYLHVRVEAPEVRMLAPTLLSKYRNPFADPAITRAGSRWSLEQGRRAAGHEGQGYDEGTEPIVWAGFDFRTSETGYGAVRMTPVIKVKICDNGLVIDADSFRRIHLGARQDEGIFRASEATQRAELELIKNQAADSVRSWLDIDFIRRTVERLEELASAPVRNAAETVETVTKGLQFSNAERDSVLGCFIAGGQMTAGGLMHAVSAAAQTIENPDRARDVEFKAVLAMSAAAKLNS